MRAKERRIVTMHSKLKALLAACGIAVAIAGAAGAAQAKTPWQADHPWRVEVNHRLAIQNHRINVERRDGRITAARAHRLHFADARVLAQERWFARHHGTHLTRAEHMRLSHEENRISHRIG